MYEFFVLGQLSRRPMHGYLIAKIIGHMCGPFRPVQWGTLYPVLNRLERQGYITEKECEDSVANRGRKAYSITPSGLDLLRRHLLDTERHAGDYSPIFTYKVAFFHLLEPVERLRLCRHYAVYAQQHMDHMQRRRGELLALPPPDRLSPEQVREVFAVLDHESRRWTLERSWAEELIASLEVPPMEKAG
jgi:DNA-binding PadR family transcriptional regulator